MCPEVADEDKIWVEVGWRYTIGADGSGLAFCTFILGLKGPALLSCVGSFGDDLARGQ